MDNTRTYEYSFADWSETDAILVGDVQPETGTLEISGTGEVRIVNTGGASASEGGMGTGGDSDEKAKGELSKPREDKDGSSSSADDDTTFDPIKKNVREAEKSKGTE
jgi:hypothetical protein